MNKDGKQVLHIPCKKGTPQGLPVRRTQLLLRMSLVVQEMGESTSRPICPFVFPTALPWLWSSAVPRWNQQVSRTMVAWTEPLWHVQVQRNKNVLTLERPTVDVCDLNTQQKHLQHCFHSSPTREWTTEVLEGSSLSNIPAFAFLEISEEKRSVLVSEVKRRLQHVLAFSLQHIF